MDVEDDKERRNMKIEWLWTIEYIASCNQVEPSILHDLIELAPELPDELGENMRERVALHCLEQLFGPSDGMTNDAPSNLESRVRFDSSESCQDVLQRILRESSVLDLKASGPAPSKWDVCPFIRHKRLSLPKCALQQLKDKIVEGIHPDADLRKYSGLVCQTNMDRISENRRETVARGNENQNMVNRNLILGDGSHNTQLAPSKRDRKDLEAGNLVGQIHGAEGAVNSSDEINVIKKRLRDDTSSIDTSARHNPVRQQGEELVEVCSERVVRATEVVGNEFPRNHQDRGLEGSKPLEDSLKMSSQCQHAETENVADSNTTGMPQDSSLDEYIQLGIVAGANDADQRMSNAVLSKRTGHNYRADEPSENRSLGANNLLGDNSGQSTDVEVGKEVECNNNIVPHGTSKYEVSMVDQADDADHRVLKDTPSQRTEHETSAGEPNDREDHYDQQKPLNDELDELQENINPDLFNGGPEHVIEEEEMSADSGEYHDERIDIDRRKNDFLNSQCTLGQNSLRTVDWTERNLCVKCIKDGQLLFCSNSGCQLVIHENCLGFPVQFDDKGNFYCPFCAYYQAISEYLEAKKKASLAKKDVEAFVYMRSNHHPVHHAVRSVGKQLGKNGHVDIGANIHHDGSGEAEHNKQNQQENDIHDCRFRKGEGGKQQSEPSTSDVNVGIPRAEANAGGGDYCVPTGETEEALAVQRAHPRCTGAEQVPKKVCTKAEMVVQKQITDPKEKPMYVLHVDEDETSRNEDDRFIISKYFIRHRGQQENYAYPSTPQLRRKRIPWTSKEEQMLMKGVQKFSNVHDRTIPWKKILEIGGSVFSDRTPMDLKDKWRNMCKGSPRSV